MAIRWLLAFVHLIALPLGVATVFIRARALRAVARGGAPATAISADVWWAVAAFLWISTGLARVFMETEKPTEYYMHNWLFHTKMTLLLIILVLEVRPIVVISRWRGRIRKQQEIHTAAADNMATTSYVQLVLAILMVIAATGMARGVGIFG
jgi:putative membrane protein